MMAFGHVLLKFFRIILSLNGKRCLYKALGAVDLKRLIGDQAIF